MSALSLQFVSILQFGKLEANSLLICTSVWVCLYLTDRLTQTFFFHTKSPPCSFLIFSWDRVVKKVVQFCLVKLFCFWKLVEVLKWCIYVQRREYNQIVRLFNAYIRHNVICPRVKVSFFKLEVKVFGLKCYEVISGFVSVHLLKCCCIFMIITLKESAKWLLRII